MQLERTMLSATSPSDARMNFARWGLRASEAANELSDRYVRVRQRTEALVKPLSPEDMVVQSMPDASPAKWHLAHTTWFFETFLLSIHSPGYRVFDPDYHFLFNSYYEALGPRQPRAKRGLLTRPSSIDVMTYRRYVDGHMRKLLQFGISAEAEEFVRLGLAHEEQHQELLLMEQRWMFSGVRLARELNRSSESSEPTAEDSDFAVDVVAGLSARHKQLPPKYFYDATGSRLFEEICRTDDYYVTRSETALLRNVAAELAAGIPEGAALVEFGSGESAKTRLLLDAAPQLSAYVPIDISADALSHASARLARDYPQLSIAPLAADFTGYFRL